MDNETRDNRFVYEASAIVEGEDGVLTEAKHNFVQNRSEDSPEAAKRGLRSKARLRHPHDYGESEHLTLSEVEVYKLDPNDGYKPVEQVE